MNTCRQCGAQIARGRYCHQCLQRVTTAQLSQHISWLEWEANKSQQQRSKDVSPNYGKPKFAREKQKPAFQRELTGAKAELSLLITQLCANGALDGLEANTHMAHIREMKIVSKQPKAVEPIGGSRCRACGTPCEARLCQVCKNSCASCERLFKDCVCQVAVR